MNNEEKKKEFTGFYVPNSTQVPDTLFDELLSELSGAELKVVLYIIRRTFGFKRQTDTISISQMLSGITKRSGEVLDKGTGLSKPTLLKAIKELADKGIILPTRKYDEKGGNMPTEYRLHIVAEPPQERGDDTLGKETLPSPLGKKILQGEVKKNDHPLVKKSYPQGTGLQGTENNTVNVNGFSEKEKPKTADEQAQAPDKTDLRKLPSLNVPKEQTQFMAQTILEALGDKHSQNFYYLVASKIPARRIRKALAEIKQDGAKFPERVFASRMKIYAEEMTYTEEIMDDQKEDWLFDLRKSLADSKKLA
jgi:hypothetical protein